MEFGIADEIYEDILININEFTMIRFFRENHVDEVNPESKEDKDTVHAWPNQYAIDRFHRKNKARFVEELELRNVEILDSEFLFVYLLDNENYEKYKPEEMEDYLRFKHLENFFMIERFMHWARKNVKIDIELEFKETFPNKFDDMKRISNTVLLDYLMRHPKRDELTWIIRARENPSKYFKIDYTMTPLVFKELELYFDDPFKLKQKDEGEENEGLMGYVLEEDRERFDKIVEKSYDNFKYLVTDLDLYQKVKQHFETYKIE